LSIGNSPRSLFVDQQGKGRRSYCSSQQTPEDIVMEAKKVLPNILGRSLNVLTPMDAPLYKKWSSIRRSSLREIFILEFIERQMKEKKISLKEARLIYKQMIAMLSLGICVIQFENGLITGYAQNWKQNKETRSEKTVTGILVANFHRRSYGFLDS
jgi:hypothetical protein